MSRREIQHHKGEYTSDMTSSELCRYLNIDLRTLRRRRKAGTIPEPAHHTPQGWGLWSPAQQRELLAREARV